MTKTINRQGNEYEIDDLSVDHPYSFDTRMIKHVHALDGSIIRLDTKEWFSGKIFIKKLSDDEIKTATMIPKVDNIV